MLKNYFLKFLKKSKNDLQFITVSPLIRGISYFTKYSIQTLFNSYSVSSIAQNLHFVKRFSVKRFFRLFLQIIAGFYGKFDVFNREMTDKNIHIA